MGEPRVRMAAAADGPAAEGGETALGPVRQLVARSGAVALLTPGESGDVITVRDREGRTLFELREGSSNVVLVVQEGDLELRADRGRVRIVGKEGVELEGKVLSFKAEHLREVVGLLETHAKRILEKATDVYREAEGMSSTRAQQVRIVAGDTFRALAQRLRMKAKADVKVDGEKIYLG
jgi:hypothetical protein